MSLSGTGYGIPVYAPNNSASISGFPEPPGKTGLGELNISKLARPPEEGGWAHVRTERSRAHVLAWVPTLAVTLTLSDSGTITPPLWAQFAHL